MAMPTIRAVGPNLLLYSNRIHLQHGEIKRQPMPGWFYMREYMVEGNIVQGVHTKRYPNVANDWSYSFSRK